MKLSLININAEGRIKEILESDVSQKLLEFGIFPGSKFNVVGKAPFNGPIYVRVSKNLIALRLSEAENVIVE